MRLRESLKKPVYLRKRNIVKDNEANTISTFGDPITLVDAITWQASGTVQAQQYGEDLQYIRNMHYEGVEDISEGDCICVKVGPYSDPDYEVISINDDYSPRVLTLRYRNGREEQLR